MNVYLQSRNVSNEIRAANIFVRKDKCELVYSRRGNQECEKFENIVHKRQR